MDIWLIVAVVVAVAVVVLLVVLTLRRRRNRRSVEKVGAGTEALAPVAVDTPLEPGAAQDRPDPAAPRADDGTSDRGPAEDMPTEPVSTSSAGGPALPEPELRTERLPVRGEVVSAADTAEPTHVLPVVERSAPTGDRAEPNRHVRPDGDRAPAPMTSSNGGGRHRAPAASDVPALPQRVPADHQRTEPLGRPAIPPARTPEPPPNPVVAFPSPAAGPADQVPAPRAPALAGSELFSESTGPPDIDGDPGHAGGPGPTRTIADRLLGRNR